MKTSWLVFHYGVTSSTQIQSFSKEKKKHLPIHERLGIREGSGPGLVTNVPPLWTISISRLVLAKEETKRKRLCGGPSSAGRNLVAAGDAVVISCILLCIASANGFFSCCNVSAVPSSNAPIPDIYAKKKLEKNCISECVHVTCAEKPSGRARTTAVRSPKSAANGSTLFANCRHSGQRYSPLKGQKSISNNIVNFSYFSTAGEWGRCWPFKDSRYDVRQSKCKWWPHVWTWTPPSHPMDTASCHEAYKPISITNPYSRNYYYRVECVFHDGHSFIESCRTGTMRISCRIGRFRCWQLYIHNIWLHMGQHASRLKQYHQSRKIKNHLV